MESGSSNAEEFSKILDGLSKPDDEVGGLFYYDEEEWKREFTRSMEKHPYEKWWFIDVEQWTARVAAFAEKEIRRRRVADLAQESLEACMNDWDQGRISFKRGGVRSSFVNLCSEVVLILILVWIPAVLLYPERIFGFGDWVAICCGLPLTLSVFAFVVIPISGWVFKEDRNDALMVSLTKKYPRVFLTYSETTIFGYAVKDKAIFPDNWNKITCDWDGCEHWLPKWEGVKERDSPNKCYVCEKYLCGKHWRSLTRFSSCESCDDGDLPTLERYDLVESRWTP
tara:strand:+ start:160 stop:1008 length:849 start_codon:yes stop_codon:yes gene_type:complete